MKTLIQIHTLPFLNFSSKYNFYQARNFHLTFNFQTDMKVVREFFISARRTETFFQLPQSIPPANSIQTLPRGYTTHTK